MSFLKRPYTWHDAEVVYTTIDGKIRAVVSRGKHDMRDGKLTRVSNETLWTGYFASPDAAKQAIAIRFPAATVTTAEAIAPVVAPALSPALAQLVKPGVMRVVVTAKQDGAEVVAA